MSEDDADVPEGNVNFTGCSCDHDPEEHGWGYCAAGDGDCPCGGGWEE